MSLHAAECQKGVNVASEVWLVHASAVSLGSPLAQAWYCVSASVMVRDVDNLQRAYDVVQSRSTQAQMEAQTTQTNLSVVKAATRLRASRPTVAALGPIAKLESYDRIAERLA